jgi:hypothetical protein
MFVGLCLVCAARFRAGMVVILMTFGRRDHIVKRPEIVIAVFVIS